jgi:hypothetical protein
MSCGKMSSASQTTFHRRPALIPPGIHLSSEDEQSILLRIGNLHLASPGNQPSSSNFDSSHCRLSSRPLAVHRPLIDVVTDVKSASPISVTKRKASTTAEQYQELNCTVEEALTSDPYQHNQPDSGGRSTSYTTLPGPSLQSNNISLTEKAFLACDCQSLSSKDRSGSALHDFSLQSS